MSALRSGDGPIHARAIVDLDEVARLVASGHLSEQWHQTLGYRILNYTSRTVIEHRWNDTTERCRGLVLDTDDRVVARPVRKFHNFTGVRPPGFVLTKSPLVYEKVDGSLGIVVPTPDGPIVATRGSFESEQAVHATEVWAQRYSGVQVPAGVTLLVEIVYPRNQIVVDYRDRDELVLLGAIDNRTGADVSLWEVGWPGTTATLFPGHGLESAYRFATGNDMSEREGVVLVWTRPGHESYRLKVKHPDYVRRHATIFGLSSVSLWRRLVAGDSLDLIIADLPDELHGWARDRGGAIRRRRDEFERACRAELTLVPRDAARADQARVVKELANPAAVFQLLDGGDISDMAWKHARPEFEPFKREAGDT